jgi:NADH-ubiquinone oxidoreductase chain 5
MEGPTPVSALIHAATLVTAGIFLVIRCSCIFEQSPQVLVFVTIMGAMTAFFASTVGLAQYDLKRIIAYSTCSQLGYMAFACGLSHYSLALFHLANHALFKALLFLSAGSIIHGLSDEQDLRKMGGLIRFFPISYTMILIGSLALMGIPFLTGFYSKDIILESAYGSYTTSGNFAFIFGCAAALFTAFYSFRLVFLAFVNRTNTYKAYISQIHEPSLLMLTPLFILCFGSIFAGFFGKDLFIGLGNNFFGSSIITFYNPNCLSGEFIPVFVKNIPLLVTSIGVILSLLLVHCFMTNPEEIYNLKLEPRVRKIFTFLNKR